MKRFGRIKKAGNNLKKFGSGGKRMKKLKKMFVPGTRY